ncbi:MAG: aldo/keto reductase [Planctomycetota bacterium]
MASSPPKPALGKTGVILPPIVFGTSSLGNLYQVIDPLVKRDIISEWFRQSDGIVAVDTAGKYGAGLALESIAESLTHLSIEPEQILISNKLGWRRVPLSGDEPTFEPGAWVGLEHDAVQDIGYEGILRCWTEGDELLSPYRADFVSVHDPDEYLAAATDDSDRESRWTDILDAYRALGELRDRGEVQAVGVGSKDWRVSQRISNAVELDWVMLATSLTIYSHPPALLDFVETLRQRQIAVINSAVFHAGFLMGGSFFDYRPVGNTPEDVARLSWRERFHHVCADHAVAPAVACVAFGMSPPGVVATALSSSRPERIAEHVRLVDQKPPAEFWQSMVEAELLENDVVETLLR